MEEHYETIEGITYFVHHNDGAKNFYLSKKDFDAGDFYYICLGKNSEFWWTRNKNNIAVRHRLSGAAFKLGTHLEWWYYGLKINVSSQKEFESWLKMKAFA